MPFLIPILARVGLSQRLLKPVAWLITIGAVLALLAAAVWLIRRDAVDDHQTDRVEDALESERTANEADDVRRAEREAESAATTERLKEIEDADPDAAKAPASAGSRAVADRLRP